jgi:glutamate dehydrogenase/leucine dehydrogenase
MEFGRTYLEKDAVQKTSAIYDTMKTIIQIVAEKGISTATAANQLAEQRIKNLPGDQGIYLA